MKIGIRKPSIKKSIRARTTGKAKRAVKKAVIPGYGKKGTGMITNPKKAIYNKVYNKTTIDVLAPIKKSAKKSVPKKRNNHSNNSASYNTTATGITAPRITEKVIPDLSHKNIIIAYALCIFLGFAGLHRIYLGVPKGKTMLKTFVYTLGIGGIITIPWMIIDLFLIIRWYIESHNEYNISQSTMGNLDREEENTYDTLLKTNNEYDIPQPMHQSLDIQEESNSDTSFEAMPAHYKEYTKVRKSEANYTILDFETTGLSATDDEIIEVAAIKFRNDIEVDRFHSYVRPVKKDISPRITKITGIDSETVKDSPSIDNVLPDLLDFITGENIVAHNASFDMRFLLQNMFSEKHEHQKFRVIDTLTLSRKHLPFLKNHKLETLKTYLGLDVASHNALDDCLVTGELYQHIKNTIQ